jgi:nucleoside deoxyribosyltransferase
MKVYIAAPWFTPEQDQKLQALKQVLKEKRIKFFSPKDENLFGNDNTATVDEVLAGNVGAIRACDVVVAITDGKDVGTIWECGYAFAKGIQILYIWLDRKQGQKFNLMLAASGTVVYDFDAIRYQLEHFKMYGEFDHTDNYGEIE